MHVQTIDFQKSTASRQFVDSLRATGFAVIQNHPVPVDLIQKTYDEWESFFASPDKHHYTYTTEHQRGYFPFKSENAKGSALKDLKEFYHYDRDHVLPPYFSDQTAHLFQALESVGCTLLTWIEQETPANIRATFDRPMADMVRHSAKSLLRILHYPPLDGLEDEGAIRAQAHEDIDLLTLLPAASAPGLEVRDLSGTWHDIPCNPGEIVINAGDMLQMLTQNYYISTSHRVVNPKGPEALKSRYSMPLFLHPHKDVKLSEHHTQENYLQQRLTELGLLS
ncbi:MAG: isopenicillin N synthase family dioxygenase [Janthinobacterium lividum]